MCPPADRAPRRKSLQLKTPAPLRGVGTHMVRKGPSARTTPTSSSSVLQETPPRCGFWDPNACSLGLNSGAGAWRVDSRDPAGAPQGQATPPHSADLSQTSGNLHPLQRGELETLPGGTEHVPTVLVTIRPPGGPSSGTRQPGAEPPGDDKTQARLCVHTHGQPLAFDMHCQSLNFTIHSTFQLSTHGKRRAFVEGLPLNTSEIPPNTRVPTPTPRPVQSLGCPVFGKPTGILQPKRKTLWKTPTSHLSASLPRCFLGSVVTAVVVFSPFQSV